MEPKELRPFALQFSNPRQKQIYEELNELVGPGPASFFGDACWLMEHKEAFYSTTHFVAHLLREVESAIRDVFSPVVDEETSWKQNDAGSHKQQIKEILASLNIREDTREAEAWFELAERLHALAHRRGLDEPLLLGILLKTLRERFLNWIKLLDELLRHPQPTKNDLKVLRNNIPNNFVVRRYFFDRLENPEWLEPLWEKGFFQHPPAPIRDEEEGTMRFPPWPEAWYLTRMALHKPELAAVYAQARALGCRLSNRSRARAPLRTEGVVYQPILTHSGSI